MYFLAKDSVWIQWMDDEILFVEPNAIFLEIISGYVIWMERGNNYA